MTSDHSLGALVDISEGEFQDLVALAKVAMATQ